MKMWTLAERKGGRTRPPLFLGRFPAEWRRACWLAAGVGLCLTAALLAPGQSRLLRPGHGGAHLLPSGGQAQRSNDARHRAGNAPQDPAAVALVKKMLSPQGSYAGEEVTERGGQVSRQHLLGLKSRLRMDFLEPPALAGDIMLIAPNHYRYYHKRTNTLDIALWPTQQGRGGVQKRILNAIQKRRIAVAQVGQEIIAGHNAAIVELSAEGPAGSRRVFESKYWIDPESGVKLKQEISGPRGLVSRSYFTRIVIGPEAGVTPKDFEPPILQSATPNVIFPANARHFATVAEARPQLPFTPLEPGTLPPGFRLSGVWVFPPSNTARTENYAALLRYSDGLINFNLYERLHPSARPLLRGRGRPASRRSIQRWQVPLAGGGTLDILYVGHLAPAQVQAIRDSLR